MSPGLNPLWPWLNFYDYLHQMTADGSQWRRFRAKCVTVGGTEPADDAFISWDVVNYTNGVVDDTWTTADYDTCVGQLSLILSAWSGYMPTSKEFTEIAAYTMAYNPNYVVGSTLPGQTNPFLQSGPPVHIATQAHVGVVAQAQAPQVSFTVTELVPLRKHWGRFFLPFPAGGIADVSDLQAPATLCDSIATTVHGVYNNLASSEFYVVIPQTQADKTTNQSLLQVTGVQVDSNFDVQRRRRARTTRYRKVL